ncbi:polycomb group protein EMBRYONIC FLOWER 2-like isoform X2 [Chenopodium quinoa]|uniref:polycomb group protein EMBRYONIC FLOWER 2-like isoform X2 n=1 Tax=Chenopodium quinoa TaxID=63459 RepID=UPI000B78FAF4|nr:polycomb group protein EMBRYONIC FLOWER 2-like isoform X2 [Chenopodium quinoa]
MPGIPLVARETIQSRNGDQSCRQDSRVHLSAEEEIAAEESLSAYCKPVELYNILQRRARRNPLFLQRSLHYKVQTRHHRRIQMTVSLSGALDDGLQMRSLCPMHIILAKALSDTSDVEHSAVYRYTKARLLTSPRTEGGNVARVKFILPEMNKLVREAKSGSLFILFVSYAGVYTSYGFDSSKVDNISLSTSVEKSCLWGKISMESLFLSWEKFPNLSRGERVEMLSTIDLRPCLLKSFVLGEEKCISFQMPKSSTYMSLQHAQVNISAEERGAKEKSPYSPCTSNSVPNLSSHALGLRTGNVVFNYRYYHNKLQRTEVTEDFSCPFCLVKCASFQGLKLHLLSCHDLFNFEFWVTQEYQAVNVSVKIDPLRLEIVADGVDPKQLIFFLCFKRQNRRTTKLLVDKTKHVQPLTLTSDVGVAASDLLNKADGLPQVADLLDQAWQLGTKNELFSATSKIERARSSSVNDSLNAVPDPDCIQSVSGSSIAPPALLQFAKTRKLSMERSDFRSRAVMEKRQFFHSHRAQPMALEQIFSEHDSEDEVDDDVADLEDRRMLDDFVDVSKDEKQIMHLWNSFARKQRVLADGHIPWACEAFSRAHGNNLVQAPALIWCWRLFMIKLWNLGLLDARTMNNCSIILEQCQKQETTPVLKAPPRSPF